MDAGEFQVWDNFVDFSGLFRSPRRSLELLAQQWFLAIIN
jgi:hypothetical protein